MPTVNTQGTLTADGTEQTVWSVTTNKYFSGQVDLQNMQTGDTVVMRRYVKVRSASTQTLEWAETYTNAQTGQNVINFPPWPADVLYAVTLQQTAGTNRAYDYKLWEA